MRSKTLSGTHAFCPVNKLRHVAAIASEAD